MAEPREITEYHSDHDLLVRLDERVGGLVNSISVLTEASKLKNEDHEGRLRALEKSQEAMQSSSRTWRFVISTGFSVIAVVLTIIGLVLSR